MPCKSRKNVSNVKYHDKVKETKLYQWLMLHVATKVEGEKLLSLHHPFDTQINEAKNNAESRRCPKQKQVVFWRKNTFFTYKFRKMHKP